MYVPVIEYLVELEQYSQEDAVWKHWTTAKGEFVSLSKGDVHYVLEGDAEEPLVIILHGISTSSAYMGNISKSLQQSGFRTLMIDFYGRGHSSSPVNVVHNEQLFVNQIVELLQKLNSIGKITSDQASHHHILGWSLGGAVALVYSSLYPERIRSATLIAPPGLPFDTGFAGRLVFIPYFGEFLQISEFGQRVARALMEPRVPRAFVNPSNFTHIIRPLKMLMYYHLMKEGFLDAFLSSMRNFRLHELSPVYSQVGQEKFPVMFIWGELDATVPLQCGKQALQYIPRAELVVLPNAGHDVFIEKEPETIEKIATFVSKSEKRQ